MIIRKLVGLILFCFFITAQAKPNNAVDNAVFNILFTTWTTAFNNKNLPQTCALFSPKLKADYRGTPPKTFTSICDGFKKVFADKSRKYVYRFKLNDIYATGDLAAVRITWYLDIYENEKLISTTQDEGLDILQKTPAGWKIVNYLGYEASSEIITPKTDVAPKDLKKKTEPEKLPEVNKVQFI